MFEKTLLLLVLASALFFVSCGSGGGNAGAGAVPAGGLGAAGPVDGTWNETGVLCNGIAGTGTATQSYTAPNSTVYVVNNTSGTFKISSGACTISASMGLSYPAANSVVVTPNGNWSCNPTGCAGAVCGTAISPAPITYHYTRSGSTISLLVAAGADQTCTGATPAQSNPVTHLFTIQ